MNFAIICGCTRLKTESAVPIPAIELYQGACVPELRAYVTRYTGLRARTFFMSGKYGLLAADDPIATYDQLLTIERAKEIRPEVGVAVARRILEPFRPARLLIILGPIYFIPLADVLMHPLRPLIHWEPDIENGWPAAVKVLESWQES